MVQEQLVEYISSQMKLGVTRDAIKASLVGAGWVAIDVEDTLKKVEGASQPAKPTAPAMSSMSASSPMSSSSKPTASAFPTTGMSSKANDPQMIRVSDLVSSGGASASASSSVAKPASISSTPSSFASTPASKVFPAKPSTVDIKTEKPMTMSTMTPSRGGLVQKIIGILLIVVFAGAAGFFYWQNMSLTSKVSSLSAMSTDVTSKIATLTTQVDALNASNTALSAGQGTLSSQNSELALELSFYAMPPGGSTSAIGPVNISGALSGGGKAPYLVTTSYGAKIYVQNSKDAKVIAAFAPLVGNPLQVAGTYVQGSQNITVTAVNGTPL